VSTTQEVACLAVTQVDHSSSDLANRVQRQDWLVAQEEASHVELLKGQLSQLLPVCLHNRGLSSVAACLLVLIGCFGCSAHWLAALLVACMHDNLFACAT